MAPTPIFLVGDGVAAAGKDRQQRHQGFGHGGADRRKQRTGHAFRDV